MTRVHRPGRVGSGTMLAPLHDQPARRACAAITYIGTAMIASGAVIAQAGTIADARTGGPGLAVTLDNVVVSTTTDLIASTTSRNLHVQDATGGITVFGENATISRILRGPDNTLGTADDVVSGSQIDLSGFTSSFNGLFELISDVAAPMEILSNDGFVGIPAAAPIGLADMQDFSPTAEGFESELVVLNNVRFTSAGVFAGVSSYAVTDGSLFGVVRIATNALDLVGTPIPSGQVNITGILTQFDTSGSGQRGYLLQPRRRSDIVAVPEPVAVAWVCSAAVFLRRRSANWGVQE